MGAPKQKWTAEEETALKSGVVKHGAGKWRTILKDPEFSSILYLRSNVDLKDKWRNMSVMANGWGSREKARLALKKMQSTPKLENRLASSSGTQSEDESVELKPHSPGDSQQASGSKRPNLRMDNLIMEAITDLKEPGGSNKTTIGNYIEGHYSAPPNFKRLLSAKLKYLVSGGKLVKVKRKYRILTSPVSVEKKKKSPHPSQNLSEGRSRLPSGIDYDKYNLDDIKATSKAETDLELAKMRNMTAEEAAIAAARAVAEAEAAIAEAEEAAREAEAAEAEAEAAMAFAEAAKKTLKGRTSLKVVRVGACC